MSDVRSLPRQVSSQAAVLGCLLIDPSLCGEIFARVQAEDFVTPEYRHVYEAARRLFFGGKDVDAVTICHEAGGDMYRDLLMQIIDLTPSAAGWNEYVEIRRLFFGGKDVDAVTICHEAGGDMYRDLLMQIIDLTPSAAGWNEYVEILLSDVRLYRLHLAGDKLASCTTVADGLAVLSEAQQLGNEQTGAAIVSMAQGIVDFYDRQGQTPNYLQYGIGLLDRCLRTSPGDFVVIGGRPSAGKTALAIQIADKLSEKHRIGFFSLETSDAQIFDRLIAQSCMVDFGAIKDRKIPEADYIRLTERQRELSNRKLDVIHASGMSVADIQAITLSKQYEIIMIDYLQLLRETGRNANRTEAVSRMSMELHRLAQTHGVTVIALSQLGRPENNLQLLRETGRNANRTEAVSRMSMELHRLAQTHGVTVIALSQLGRPENKGELQKAPTLSSLRESGQIEQDADAVLLLYLTDPADPHSDRRLKVAKNKEGELGTADLNFEGRFQIEQDADAVLLLYLTDPADPHSDRRLKVAKNKEGELGTADLNFEGRFQRFIEYMPEEKPTKIPKFKPQQMRIEGRAI